LKPSFTSKTRGSTANAVTFDTFKLFLSSAATFSETKSVFGVRLFGVVIWWSIVVVGLQLLHIDPCAALHVPAGESLQDDLEGRVFEHFVQSGVRVKRAVRNFKGRPIGRDALHG
jgi:hypothetical protein